MLSSLIPGPWKEILSDSYSAIDNLGSLLQKRADQGERILPDKKYLFRALELSPEEVKVIIVGQDPYPNISDAIGLSFAVPSRKTGLPGSLLNIQKEIMTDIGSTTTADGDLTRWANQGVMLLNRVLTVTAGESGSHSKLGWQEITEKIVSHCANLGAIGLLWGSSARELSHLFDAESLVEGVHPSPLSAHRGFLGSKPFSKVNELLARKAKSAIIW
jgi:uracil-DNA glycosylase